MKPNDGEIWMLGHLDNNEEHPTMANISNSDDPNHPLQQQGSNKTRSKGMTKGFSLVLLSLTNMLAYRAWQGNDNGKLEVVAATRSHDGGQRTVTMIQMTL